MEKNELPTTFTQTDLENFDRRLTYANEHKMEAVGCMNWVADDYPKFLVEIAMLRSKVVALENELANLNAVASV